MRTLGSPAGSVAEANAHGALTRLEVRGLSLLLNPATSIEAGATNVHLRVLDRGLAPARPAAGTGSRRRRRGRGRRHPAGHRPVDEPGLDLAYRLTLALSEDEPAWSWHLDVTNLGRRAGAAGRGVRPRPGARSGRSRRQQPVLRQPVPRRDPDRRPRSTAWPWASGRTCRAPGSRGWWSARSAGASAGPPTRSSWSSGRPTASRGRASTGPTCPPPGGSTSTRSPWSRTRPSCSRRGRRTAPASSACVLRGPSRRPPAPTTYATWRPLSARPSPPRPPAPVQATVRGTRPAPTSDARRPAAVAGHSPPPAAVLRRR